MLTTRRVLIQSIAAGLVTRRTFAQVTPVKKIATPVLDIAYEESGNPQGFPIILLHGFPDDARAWDDVAPPLAKAGHRVLVPYLRGYGPTSFRDTSAPRMGEQAAIGQDVIDFADALKLPRFAVSGYDWGGRAACIACAPVQPGPPEAERRIWYQWYFNTERGRAGLKANRKAFCKLLWQEWSPTWHFTDATYEKTAPSFDNPDFVDVVIHSYRHRIGNAPGEPRFEAMERKLAERPKIEVPAAVLYGADDLLVRAAPETTPAEKASFPNLIARRVVTGGGHFLPREKPDAVSSAMLEVLAATR
jgi:pimeloyl-ACP methyl ester carboxylesterase